MTLVNSLMVSLFGMAVVFFVLIVLSFFVKVQSLVLAYIMAHKNTLEAATTKSTDTGNVPAGSVAVVAAEEPESVDGRWSAGELKLLGVDEKTAAMIMAIVSDESGISLSELQFKMIKALN